MTLSSLKWMALLCVFCSLPVFAKGVKMPSLPKGTSTDTDTKDCWMYIVTNMPDQPNTKPTMAFRDGDQYRKRLHSNIQKGQCLNNDAAKSQGCAGVMAQCGNNQTPKPGVTVGVVGAWVQWGTSLEDCPSLCPGFANVSPKSFAH